MFFAFLVGSNNGDTFDNIFDIECQQIRCFVKYSNKRYKFRVHRENTKFFGVFALNLDREFCILNDLNGVRSSVLFFDYSICIQTFSDL